MGVIGSAKLLQALARDNILPGFSLFGQGTKINDEPIYAILFTYVVAQLTMLSDINQIASFVTMTYLMTFLVTKCVYISFIPSSLLIKFPVSLAFCLQSAQPQISVLLFTTLIGTPLVSVLSSVVSPCFS